MDAGGTDQREGRVGLVGVVQPADVVTKKTAQTTLDASFGAAVVSKTENFYQKKTHLGPKRRFLRRLGPFFSSLAPVSLCGLSWASSGPKRGVVSVVQPADVVTNLRNSPNDVSRVVWGCCCHGPALAFVGHRWVLWACVGLRWPSVGCCGPVLAFVGRRWVLWAFVGLRWPSLGAVGLCWPLLSPGDGAGLLVKLLVSIY